MTSFFHWRIFVVVFVLSSGCGPSVEFGHPLVDPILAPTFPELYGVYPIEDDEEGREQFLYVSSAGEGFPKGFLRIKFLVSTSEGRVEILEESALGFCAKHENDYFFHFPMKDEIPAGADDRFFQDDWTASETVGYNIDVWSFDSDANSFEWLMFNSEYLAEQIEAGHLRGTVAYDDRQLMEGEVKQPQSVHVTASEKELWRFIQFVNKHELGELAKEAFGEFHKLQFSSKCAK